MKHSLYSPYDAEEVIAKVFSEAQDRSVINIIIREDACFDAPINIGQIELKLDAASIPTLTDNFNNSRKIEPYVSAVRNGFFAWHTRPMQEIVTDTYAALNASATRLNSEAKNGQSKKDNSSDKDVDKKIPRAMLSILSAATRAGLMHPRFDADTLAAMPFRVPTSIVLDTSAILHGGMDFSVRFLYPSARLKVPAITHMEISNHGDRYFRQRRDKTLKSDFSAVLDHAASQGGQRALLRLELLTDAEIERNALFGDPLRYAFSPDKDPAIRDLGLSVPMRSYCDRLILETARQQQGQVSLGHPVVLMTCDQGMARMALAEGITPLYFTTPAAEDCDGQILNGTCFHPFDGSIYGVSLATLLWELAVTFGTAGISLDGTPRIEIKALGEELTWQPFHSRDDLLWLSEISDITKSTSRTPDSIALPIDKKGEVIESAPSSTEITRPTGIASYRINIDKLFRLSLRLADADKMPIGKVRDEAGISNGEWRNYAGFLSSGNLAELENKIISSTDALKSLASALKGMDFQGVANVLSSTPGYFAFEKALDPTGPTPEEDLKVIAGRAYETWRTLHEITGRSLFIPGKGRYLTPSYPTPEVFAEMAVICHDKLLEREGVVLTGLWLEELVQNHFVHPLVTRQRLYEAQKAGLISVIPQGASPDRRYDNHVFHEIGLLSGKPSVEKVYYYRGTFLFPDTASVELKLERKPS